jgi:hypothetical protein
LGHASNRKEAAAEAMANLSLLVSFTFRLQLLPFLPFPPLHHARFQPPIPVFPQHTRTHLSLSLSIYLSIYISSPGTATLKLSYHPVVFFQKQL